MSDVPFRLSEGEQSPRRGDQHSPPVAGDGGSDIDRFYDALGKSRRRFILLFLNENDTATLEQLAESIAEQIEGDTSDETVKRTCINLHHHHLQKLAEHGLISYDRRSNVAAIEPLPLAVERILDLTRDLERSESATDSGRDRS